MYTHLRTGPTSFVQLGSLPRRDKGFGEWAPYTIFRSLLWNVFGAPSGVIYGKVGKLISGRLR